jgi:hypothetical protein
MVMGRHGYPCDDGRQRVQGGPCQPTHRGQHAAASRITQFQSLDQPIERAKQAGDKYGKVGEFILRKPRDVSPEVRPPVVRVR